MLALASERYGVQVHAYCVMSNHYHLVVTDDDARLPACLQYLDALVARAINSLLGRKEDFFWGPDSFSAVELAGPEAIIDKASYTLANPVAAGLVRSAHRWPGLWSSPTAMKAGSLEALRPTHFFDQKGGMPEVVMLKLTAPPGFPTAEAFLEQLMDSLAEREAEAWKKVPGFLGVARVLSQKVTARPRSAESRRGLNPRVAARDPKRRVEALDRLMSFLARYRKALSEWQRGRRDVLFPLGTYQMRVAHGAVCVGAG